MTESAAPIADIDRRMLAKATPLELFDMGGNMMSEFFAEYESRLVQAEDRLRELENALGKVHTMAVLKRDEAPPAWRKDRLKTIANFVRQALKGDGK